MAQNSDTPKFPTPIPNPLVQPQPVAKPKSTPQFVEDEKTDPEITLTQELKIPSTEPQSTPLPPSASILETALSNVTQTPPHAPQQAAQKPTKPVIPAPRMPELGPIDVFMKDPSISEIMVNDLRNVMIEKNGKMQFSGFAYSGIDELNRLMRNILDITGRIISPDSPYVDVMLPDGSRVNIIAPPLTVQGPCITIRKFPSQQYTIHDLVRLEALDQRIAYFLNCCVVGRMNILICGGTGGGKTTVLNVLSTFIPKGERVITIEDTPELSIRHMNSVRLQTKPQSPASGAITARDLVANVLRMRPDRIIVGECRKAEAFDMLQAMNTGHQGSMTTLHANSPRDGLSRLETLCMMSGIEIPISAIRKQITSAIDLIVQVHRFRNGKRRITMISEVTGMESDTITLQDIFVYEEDHSLVGTQAGAVATGRFKPTGFVPTLIDRLRAQGIELPGNYFG